MRVLFVYPNIDTHTPIYYYIGTGSLSAVLRQEGHQTWFLPVEELNKQAFLEAVGGFNPDLVAFSSVYIQWRYVKQLCRWIKEEFPRPIIAGGIHPTLSPEECISCPDVDWICRGEGEYALRDVVRALENGSPIEKIENIWCRDKSGGIIKNPERPLISPLDELPYPDREYYDYDKALADMGGNLSVMTSRGCPYRCTYCSNEALMRVYQGNGRFIRQRSIENVIGELVQACERHPGARYITFSDDIITENKGWFFPFLEAYRDNVGLPFSVQVQMQTFDRETARRMADAGCYQAIIAMESGDEVIRREVMNRNLSDEQIVNAYRYCDEVGIETVSYNIMGVPGETEESIRKSIGMLQKVKPDSSLVFKFTPFPGTKLHEVCVERGYLKEHTHDSYFGHVGFMDLPTISKQRLAELFYEFSAEARKINEQKRRQRLGSYFDFFEGLPNARVRVPNPEFVGASLVRIHTDTRAALLVHPNGEVGYNVQVRPGSRLRFGITLSMEDWDRHASGVEFSIEARWGLWGKKALFSRQMAPREKNEDRAWIDCDVDLSELAGKKVDLVFRTRALSGSNAYCSSYFGNPILLEAGR